MNGINKIDFENLRIRKLTPLEAWRLMGFDDVDFDKASKVNSNTQLYKQAGNSICVNVLEAILKSLLELKSDKGEKMEQYESWTIKDGTLEYIDEQHLYIYEGIVLPSITQILKLKFNNKYDNVSKEVLSKAADAGTAVHKAIEEFEKEGKESELKELRNYKFLKKAYNFECIDNEVPVVLFKDEVPVAAGRLDLVLKEGEDIGLGDIKRTATLDKEYLTYQLNLYRIAYQQCYDTEINFIRGIHLRDDARKYVKLPINEEMAMKLVNEYLGGKENE